MNPGLPQGFVKFGTLAHSILRLILEHGKMRQTDIEEELGGEKRHISTILNRLRECGYIFPHGKASTYDTGDKTQFIYALDPPAKPIEYRKASTMARTKRYRQKKRLKVASVFDFRGSLPITGSGSISQPKRK